MSFSGQEGALQSKHITTAMSQQMLIGVQHAKRQHSSQFEFRVGQTSVRFLRRLVDRLGGLLHGRLPLAEHVVGKALALLLQVRPASLPGRQPAFQLLRQPAGQGSHFQHTPRSSADHSAAQPGRVSGGHGFEGGSTSISTTDSSTAAGSMEDCNLAGGAHSPWTAPSRCCSRSVPPRECRRPHQGLAFWASAAASGSSGWLPASPAGEGVLSPAGGPTAPLCREPGRGVEAPSAAP